MKRTGEIVLGVIGAIGYAFFTVAGFFFLWLQNQDEFMGELSAELQADDELSAAEVDAVLGFLDGGFLSSSGIFLIILSVVAIVLGIVAMVLLKGNNKPKVSGLLFIITSVVAAIATLGAGIFPGIFYLIAGIMCFARKPKEPIESY
ncbi:DUF4064 domain-containing protein [Evansella cellulosilytica]|uniref:DUF4064 domain-containing protein n=1 Tax=Evansella cellulosilytica (strain ATCC 21833 / DSM 2522 / FERM P-1141 / JCM 9156 / N-4) TaxID=649639 RepID=E6TU87_EVAC2|nr:DUF4064 domain-containing protein [Evansella cellulosilytica]ADU28547.1 hypothetical protein Bcell_0260 [Evansella cellulosilytica DSM 2522]